MTIKDLLAHSCSRFPNRTALSFVFGEPVTYAALQHLCQDIQNNLKKSGVKKGDKVAILGGNTPQWAITYYGIVSMGAVVVPILTDFHPDEIHNILEHSESSVLYVSGKMKSILDWDTLPALQTVFVLEDSQIIQSRPPVEMHAEASSDEPELPFPEAPLSDTDLAAIIYTSGTTGRPKGVMLTHRNIVFDVIQCQSIHKIRPDDVFLSILPLSHAYENTLGLHLPISCGASVYYLEKPPSASALLPALKKVRPTCMLSVPLIIEKIYRTQVLGTFQSNKVLSFMYRMAPTRKLLHRLAGAKLYQNFGGRLEFFGIGGSRLDPLAERFLKEGSFPYAIGYGLTETAPLIAGADAFKTRLTSTGPPMQGVDLKILDPNPETGIGEIVVKGTNVMKGYYKDPELTRSVFTDDGWFRTGDLGCFDKDGYLYIKGRSKTVILGASGENIYPEDIESVLNNFEGVIESLVVQQQGRLVAMVHVNWEDAKAYYHEKREEWLEEIRKKANPKLNKFSQVHKVQSVSEPFEKTPTQKIKRYLYGHKP